MPKLIWEPSTLLAPVPAVLVTCGTFDAPNVLTVAWTGIINSDPAMTYVSIRPERFSHHLIKESGEFAINLVSRALVPACDYCGVRSGAKENKFQTTGLTLGKADQIAAPIIPKSPLALECRVTQVLELGSHDMFIAKIVAVDVDEQYVDQNGRLRLDKAELVAYAHGNYFALGQQLGSFGFSVRKHPAGKAPVLKPTAGKTATAKQSTGKPPARKKAKPRS